MLGVVNLDKPVGPTSHDMVGPHATPDRHAAHRPRRHAGPARLRRAAHPGRRGNALQRRADRRPQALRRRDPARGAQRDRRRPGADRARRWRRFPDEEAVRDALAAFVGTFDQVPPAFSARKQGGRTAHRAARAGEPIDLAPRSVTIDAIELLELRTGRGRRHAAHRPALPRGHLRALAGPRPGRSARLRRLPRRAASDRGRRPARRRRRHARAARGARRRGEAGRRHPAGRRRCCRCRASRSTPEAARAFANGSASQLGGDGRRRRAARGVRGRRAARHRLGARRACCSPRRSCRARQTGDGPRAGRASRDRSGRDHPGRLRRRAPRSSPPRRRDGGGRARARRRERGAGLQPASRRGRPPGHRRRAAAAAGGDARPTVGGGDRPCASRSASTRRCAVARAGGLPGGPRTGARAPRASR